MTKQELEKAIENGESVWTIYKGQSNVYEIKSNNIEKVLNDTFLWGKEYYSNIKDVYKTKAEAEHYLHHANVTRTEQLPFLTWEEFKNKERIIFTTPTRFICALSYLDNILTLSVGKNNECTRRFVWDLTESNFYKAYDECVRLFRGQ